MSDDICDRLMRFAGKVCLSTDTEVEAADEIERLRAENEKLQKDYAELNETNAKLLVLEREREKKLRAALKPFVPNTAVTDPNLPDSRPIDVLVRVGDLRAARAALKETGDE